MSRNPLQEIIRQAVEKAAGSSRPLVTLRQRRYAAAPIEIPGDIPAAPPSTVDYFTIGTSLIGGTDPIR